MLIDQAVPSTYSILKVSDTRHLRYLAIASTLVPLILAVLGIAAWSTGQLVLASFHAGYIPMAPSTALAFAFVSVALIALARGGQAITREVVRGIALLVSVLAVIEVGEFVTGIAILNAEEALIAEPARFGEVLLARMSPVTAVALVLVGIALTSLTVRSLTWVHDLAGTLGAMVLLVGATVILGYLYGAPLLYGGGVIPVALTTGMALFGSGLALIALTGPTGLPLRPFFGAAVRAAVAERRQREVQDRSAYVIEAAGAGIWEIDLATGTTRWSAMLASMCGLPAEPLETTLDDFRDRIHPEDRAGVEGAIMRLIEQDVPYGMQFRVRWPDGRMRWLSSKGRVGRNSAGEPIELLGMSVDVTERKELEERLQHAQKMESLGRVAGAIAHDFNNVLTAILGFSELLLADLDPADPHAADVAEIRRAGESGQLLTRQLRAFSRQQPMELTQVDLNTVVTRTAGMLQQLLGPRVRLRRDLASSLGSIRADAGQIQQVLVNLAVNARDAMPEGGQFVIETFDVDRRDTPGAAHAEVDADAQVVLRIADTGVGMTPETQARIFEPFFTTKAPDKGTGLGLSTVYGIVRQNAGAVDVSSTVSVGTTFSLYFPTWTENRPAQA